MSTKRSADTADRAFPRTETGPSTRSVPRGEALLRLALKLDAGITGLNGVAYVLAAPVLADLLGLSAGPLRSAGAFLLAFTAALLIIATRTIVSPAAVWTVVALNLAWAVGSVAVAATGLGTPTTAGTVWIILQAIVVAGFAALQRAALRQTSP